MFSSYRRVSKALMVAGVSALALSACAHKDKKPTLAYEERPVELLYSTGADRLDRRRWTEAVDYFHEVERQHPYSEWSRRAILMTAYAHYEANDYDNARDDADRFVSLYPGNPSAVYDHYIKAICYFEQIIDVGRDQAATEQTLAALREVVRRYPTSEYATDAKLKIDMVNDQLAGKEMAIGRYYESGRMYLAAINRYRRVIDNYQTTTHVPEALERLTECYTALGLTFEATKMTAILGYNYPGNEWYSDSYTLVEGKDAVGAKKDNGWFDWLW